MSTRILLERLIALPAIVLLLSACAGPAPRTPGMLLDDHAAADDLTPARHQVVNQAIRQIGTPYRYGGSDPTGFDCSGLVQYTYSQVGVSVPRVAQEQLRHASPVARTQLRPGDLLFFEVEDKGRHVGIYVGRGQFIHAPSSGKEVTRSRLDSPYWRDHLVAAGTYL